MDAKKCPLCNSSTSSLKELILSDHIVRMYNEQLKIDTASHFQGFQTLRYMECRTCGLRYIYPVIVGNEEFYRHLCNIEWYYMADKWEFRTAASCVKPTDSVLEIGCGNGLFSNKIECTEYVGLEQGSVDLPENENTNKKFFYESVEEHAEKNIEHYDVACAFQVLEHIHNPKKFIEACIKSLKPGGLLFISTPNADSFVSMVINHALNLPPHHVTHWPEKIWKQMAELFPLHFEWTKYEPLQKHHLQHYVNTVTIALARKMVGLSDRLVDYSLQHEEALRLSKGLYEQCLAVLGDVRIQPGRGHTILACFSKEIIK